MPGGKSRPWPKRDRLGEEAIRGSVRREEDSAAMQAGDDVVYLADVPLFGCMELRTIRRDGMVVCRLDTGEFEVFGAHEVDTPEAVARAAVAATEEG